MDVRGLATVRASVLLAGTLLAAPAAAAAASPSLDQYVESVPTSQGPHRPTPPSHGHVRDGGAQGGGAPAHLPAATRRALAKQGGSAAPALTAIATDPGRGAPASGTPSKQSGGAGAAQAPSTNGRQGGDGSTASSSPNVLSATVHGAGSGGGAQLPLLLLGLLVITAVSAGMAVRSRTRGG